MYQYFFCSKRANLAVFLCYIDFRHGFVSFANHIMSPHRPQSNMTIVVAGMLLQLSFLTFLNIPANSSTVHFI